jgi:hypothetical protein
MMALRWQCFLLVQELADVKDRTEALVNKHSMRRGVTIAGD